jgi:endonuclease/exonuclease/phosphatase family metal-dependent hydrolase
MSANLWHDWPRYRGQSERLESFARLVESRQVDVLLLQEVARTPHLRVDEWLAERLDMAFVYSRANGHEDAIGFEEGLGVFSRFPLSTPHLRQLSPGGDSFVRRMALGATLATPCGEVLAVSAHLSLRRKRNAAQVAHLREWVESLADSRLAVVGGDFNASEESEQITQTQGVWVDAFRHLHPDAEDATHVVRWPWGGILRQSRLDYVFFHPGRGDWKVMEASHLSAASQPHSDHRAVFARLLWEPCGGLPEVTLH